MQHREDSQLFSAIISTLRLQQVLAAQATKAIHDVIKDNVDKEFLVILPKMQKRFLHAVLQEERAQAPALLLAAAQEVVAGPGGALTARRTSAAAKHLTLAAAAAADSGAAMGLLALAARLLGAHPQLAPLLEHETSAPAGEISQLAGSPSMLQSAVLESELLDPAVSERL